MSAEGSSGLADGFWLFGYGSLIWKPPPHFGTSIRPFTKTQLPRERFGGQFGMAGADQIKTGESQAG
ncbi:hypothetical protein VTI74DRAFT_460 [Chaetomium olivicolor]